MFPKLNRRGFLAAGFSAIVAQPFLGPRRSRAKTIEPTLYRARPRIVQTVDVLVAGGGPAGVAAALAARRQGAKVLLVEANGQLGGNGTSGLVSHWLGGRLDDCQRWAVGGVFKRMALESVERGFALLPTDPKDGSWSPHGWSHGGLTAGVPFDPYAMAAFLDEQVVSSGIDLSFHSRAIDVVRDENRLTQVIISDKEGLRTVAAAAVVDATGDADLAFYAGCPVRLGRDEDNGMAAATLMFHVIDVEQEELSDYIHRNRARRFRERVAELRQQGEWNFPYDIFISVQLMQPGTLMINTSRLVGIDGTRTESITDGLIRGRRETQELMRLLRKHFPGFSRARIKSVAPVLGIRETRRIRGEFELTVQALNQGLSFADTIGYSAYCWDLPDPERPSENPTHGERREVVPLPFRMMLPRGVDNLICPGRSVSVERPVLGPIRVMAPCMAMGEAAGTAAATVAAANSGFNRLDIDDLRNTLRQNGVIVDWPSSD
ncbi:FAD-dependent oxidoreductase [candidate division KSB1 bacterium]|nr:FAD-dependent oxidoreductase [candidate division KSB1 bacterium]